MRGLAVTHLQTVPMTPAHLSWMCRRLEPVMTSAHLDRAVTVLEGEVPLCCFGVSTVWSGVGVAWFLEREVAALQPHARTIARHVMRAWKRFAVDFRYVEALVVADRADSRRLIEWLGFEPVVVKEGYGPGGETMMEYRWRRTNGR